MQENQKKNIKKNFNFKVKFVKLLLIRIKKCNIFKAIVITQNKNAIFHHTNLKQISRKIAGTILAVNHKSDRKIGKK